MNKVKKLLMLILLASTVSCSSDKKSMADDYKITKKEYGKIFTTLPAGVCIYTYGPNNTETQDSCNKYNIGDQINH